MAIRIIEFKDMELHYAAASDVTVKFSTDQPGNAMAVRKTLTFPAAATNRVLTLPLDGAEGNLFKVRAESAGVVKLYDGLVRGRAVGMYFDGSNGEVFETLPQAA